MQIHKYTPRLIALLEDAETALDGYVGLPELLGALDRLKAKSPELFPSAAPTGWIKLSERKPTEAEGDKNGSVFQLLESGNCMVSQWSELLLCTHWMPIPPPPKAPTQAELDEAAYRAYLVSIAPTISKPLYSIDPRAYFLAGIKHARGQSQTSP